MPPWRQPKVLPSWGLSEGCLLGQVKLDMRLVQDPWYSKLPAGQAKAWIHFLIFAAMERDKGIVKRNSSMQEVLRRPLRAFDAMLRSAIRAGRVIEKPDRWIIRDRKLYMLDINHAFRQAQYRKRLAMKRDATNHNHAREVR